MVTTQIGLIIYIYKVPQNPFGFSIMDNDICLGMRQAWRVSHFPSKDRTKNSQIDWLRCITIFWASSEKGVKHWGIFYLFIFDSSCYNFNNVPYHLRFSKLCARVLKFWDLYFCGVSTNLSWHQFPNSSNDDYFKYSYSQLPFWAPRSLRDKELVCEELLSLPSQTTSNLPKNWEM